MIKYSFKPFTSKYVNKKIKLISKIVYKNKKIILSLKNDPFKIIRLLKINI